MAAEGAPPQTSSSAPASTALQQNPLSKKLHRILQSNLDNDKETLEALEVLSGFLDKNTLQARRNLRGDLERRCLVLNDNFVQCLGTLVEQVQGLQEESSAMKTCCENMQTRLAAAKSRTSGLLKETSELQSKSRELEMQSKVVSAFLDKFQLSPEESEVIRGRYRTQNGAINDKFFSAMERVRHIHEDCKVLLRTSQQRAGLEVMESMAMHLESAYEQLYHWCQHQCRTMNTDFPEISVTLRKALKELKERPILFQYCIDEYSIARRMALVRSFIDALTREGNTGRPIELHSHDPVRYCGDMLGWLHQAIATENDHVASLLSEHGSEQSLPILSMVTEGCCRPLHTRVEQVVVSSNQAVIAYKLVNHLRYYAGVFRGLLNTSAPLVKTVTDLSELQSKMFFSALNAQTAKILEGMETPLPDLSPSPKAGVLLSLLQSILSSQDLTALTSDHQEHHLLLILSTCIDPLIQACNDAVASLSRLDRSVYLVNSLYLIQSTVSLYEFTDRQVESLELQMQAHMDTVISEQSGHMSGVVGFNQFCTALAHNQLSKEAFQSLSGCSQLLTPVMSAPDQYQLPQCKLLVSVHLREAVQQKAFEQFCLTYESIYAALTTEKGLETAKAAFPQPPEQIRKLLLS